MDPSSEQGRIVYSARVEGEVQHPAGAELPTARLSFGKKEKVRISLKTGDGHSNVAPNGTVELTAVTPGMDVEILANAAIINVFSRDGVPCAAFCQTRPETETPSKPYVPKENVGVEASPRYLAPEANTAAGGDSVVYVIVGEGSYKNGEIPPKSKALRVERIADSNGGNTLVTAEIPLNEALEKADTGLGGGGLVKIKTGDGVSEADYVVVPQQKRDGSYGLVGDNGVVLLYERGNEEHIIKKHRTSIVLAG